MTTKSSMEDIADVLIFTPDLCQTLGINIIENEDDNSFDHLYRKMYVYDLMDQLYYQLDFVYYVAPSDLETNNNKYKNITVEEDDETVSFWHKIGNREELIVTFFKNIKEVLLEEMPLCLLDRENKNFTIEILNFKEKT